MRAYAALGAQVRTRQRVTGVARAAEMAPFYRDACQELGREPDATLVAKLEYVVLCPNDSGGALNWVPWRAPGRRTRRS